SAWELLLIWAVAGSGKRTASTHAIAVDCRSLHIPGTSIVTYRFTQGEIVPPVRQWDEYRLN
ncbi:MAG: hypothetical protein VB855_09255, partial [Pirellulaceae bacterium]